MNVLKISGGGVISDLKNIVADFCNNLDTKGGVSGNMTHSQSTGILNGSFLVNFYFPNLDHQKLKKQHFLESIFGYYNDFLSLLNLLVLSLCVSSA